MLPQPPLGSVVQEVVFAPSCAAQAEVRQVAASGKAVPGRGEHLNCGAKLENTDGSLQEVTSHLGGWSPFLMASGRLG